jgi:hypothetical protein
MPSRSEGLVSHELLWAKMAGNVADAAVKSSSAILPRQNGQPTAPMRERESAKNAEGML